MLKGDTDFMAALLVYLCLIIIIAVTVLSPLVMMQYEKRTAADEMRAVEFANLARYTFPEVLGDGETMDIGKIESLQGSSLASFGLAEHSVIIEDIINENSWKFGEGVGGKRHDVYSIASGNSSPVGMEGVAVIPEGSPRLLVIHRSSESARNVMVDVHEHMPCDEHGYIDFAQEGPDRMACDVVEESDPENFSPDHLKNLITIVKNTGSVFILWGMPAYTIMTEELVPSGTMIGMPHKCEGMVGDYVCFRSMGDFSFPVRLRAEVRGAKPLSGSSTEEGPE